MNHSINLTAVSGRRVDHSHDHLSYKSNRHSWHHLLSFQLQLTTQTMLLLSQELFPSFSILPSLTWMTFQLWSLPPTSPRGGLACFPCCVSCHSHVYSTLYLCIFNLFIFSPKGRKIKSSSSQHDFILKLNSTQTNSTPESHLGEHFFHLSDPSKMLILYLLIVF